MGICSNCGFDVEDNNFCPNCGTKIEMEISGSVCPSCGADVGDSAFCPHCGTKIEKEISKSFCPSCGVDVGDSVFCPSCGTKIVGEKQQSLCPNCGESLNELSNFCPSCGWSKSNHSSDSTLDRIIRVDDKVSGKFGKLLGNSKSMGIVYEKTANRKRNNMEQAIEFYARNEPEFLEVYNSIGDEFVKSLLALEREKLGSVGGGGFGAVMSMVHIPTKGMSHDEAIQFYRDIVNKIVQELNTEKQKGNFNEDEFYKRKYKETAIENISVMPVLKAFKSFKK